MVPVSESVPSSIALNRICFSGGQSAWAVPETVKTPAAKALVASTQRIRRIAASTPHPDAGAQALNQDPGTLTTVENPSSQSPPSASARPDVWYTPVAGTKGRSTSATAARNCVRGSGVAPRLVE